VLVHGRNPRIRTNRSHRVPRPPQPVSHNHEGLLGPSQPVHKDDRLSFARTSLPAAR